MTRDEEIITACKSFLSRYPSIDQAGLSIGFLDGAVWSDKHPVNVWHDASEEPKAGKRICVHFGEDTCGIYTRLGKDENKWRNWCRVAHALRWAYISDLLPKQFGNSERLKG